MNIAILGATSYLARDLIASFSSKNSAELHLYGRRVDQINACLRAQSLENLYLALDYSAFNESRHYDAIINFVGTGDPAQAIALGASIFDVTRQYDELALAYLQKHPDTTYIFLSSGAVYGDAFCEPVSEHTNTSININALATTDYYGIAKLYAEAKHRSLIELNIIDLRVFNYFSSTMDTTARFFISDVLRAIRDDDIFQTTTANMYRDYLHPDDLYQLITCVLATKTINQAFDCYTRKPVDKVTMLSEMKARFGLNYVYVPSEHACGVNATGFKDHYFSLNKRAELIGYMPSRSSLQCILEEAAILLNAN